MVRIGAATTAIALHGADFAQEAGSWQGAESIHRYAHFSDKQCADAMERISTVGMDLGKTYSLRWADFCYRGLRRGSRVFGLWCCTWVVNHAHSCIQARIRCQVSAPQHWMQYSCLPAAPWMCASCCQQKNVHFTECKMRIYTVKLAGSSH